MAHEKKTEKRGHAFQMFARRVKVLIHKRFGVLFFRRGLLRALVLWIRGVPAFCHSDLVLPQALCEVKHTVGKKRLLVDVSTLVEKDLRTGIQRVVRSILIELMKHPPEGYEVEPVFSTMKSRGFFSAWILFAHRENKARVSHQRISVRGGDQFLGLDWSPFIIPKQRRQLKRFKRKGVTLKFFLYDVLPLLKPGCFPEQLVSSFKEWLFTVLQYDGMICISHQVAQDLKEAMTHFSDSICPEPKISWIHLGADFENSLPSSGLLPEAEVFLSHVANQTNFMVVSTIEPRKGYQQLLDAFDLLWKQGEAFNLLIVGKQGWMVDDLIKQIQQHPLSNIRLFWLGAVSDEYLERLYKIATCCIAPSEAEGFGLSLIEAARHGVPLIVRDIPVFREVAGVHAYYFDGFHAEILALSIVDWMRLYRLNHHPQSVGFVYLTWKESTAQLKQVLLD